ncbi:protein Red-like [Tigriopus californicus]|uniref:protein Red-like n=1 Tax=Tigriopus californicus TaxID=6832 RepID=UPI0027D9E01A|nr:protein Red-like [Tigriopus californicus]
MPEHEFLAPGSELHGSGHRHEPASQRMTNEDFRKLMMTPRGGSGSTSSVGATPTLGSGMMATPVRGGGAAGAAPRPAQKVSSNNEKAENRKKKKSYYAKLKKEEDDQLALLAAKYRDRAKERREGGVGVGGVVGSEEGAAGLEGAMAPVNDEIASSTSGYRAVGPDFKSSFDAAEARRQKIHESKFLGGDMEHTHLVKGLDFALLQKVRSEIANRETEGPVKVEPVEDVEEEKKEEAAIGKLAHPEDELQSQCRTAMGKNIVRSLFNPNYPKSNELFFPGRMAYVMDLEEDFGESDIPTTTIRSKADVEGTVANQTTLSTNDIVINKLTQILSYLRAGKSNKKKKKDKLIQMDKEELKEMRAQQAASAANLPIYDDVGDYVADTRKRKDHRDDRHRDRDRRDRDRGGRDRRDRERERGRDRDRDRPEDRGGRERDGKRNYFEKDPNEEEETENFKGGLTHQDKDYIRKLGERERDKSKRKVDAAKGGVGLETNYDGYAECYPGLEEMNDAIDDSDDEADYSKMDLGNKKGPVGRWDFDTAEEYAEYKSKQEALPKAAFQYGVKMTEGRKTRGKVGPKNEKAKLDREWNQISALIDKRKTSGPKKPRLE